MPRCGTTHSGASVESLSKQAESRTPWVSARRAMRDTTDSDKKDTIGTVESQEEMSNKTD